MTTITGGATTGLDGLGGLVGTAGGVTHGAPNELPGTKLGE